MHTTLEHILVVKMSLYNKMAKLKYIKIPIADAEKEFLVTEDMMNLGFKIAVGDDLKQYLSYSHIGDYSYVVKALYTVTNYKGGYNRTTLGSDAEDVLWAEVLDLNPTWEEVDEKPAQEQEL